MENQYLSWSDSVMLSFQNFINVIISTLPNILAAILILIAGLLLAVLLGRLTKKLIGMTKLDVLLGRIIKLESLKESGVEISLAGILGWAVKWFFIIVTFIATSDVLRLRQLTDFFKMVALYVPNIIIVILILLAGAILGDALKKLVVKSVEVSTLPKNLAGTLGAIARWSVIVFAIMASLNQLGIAAELINIMLTGFVAMLALAGGLAFGLGGKDMVRDWLDKMRRK